MAGYYAYDNNGVADDELTLRSNSDEINDQLEAKLNDRLSMAGIEVIEARINYLAYAPEIAAVMLRRQQADAIISAREKIVEGAVTMVKMALDRLADDRIVELDEERKAAMVSNLLVVLCADEAAQPIVNAGTLRHYRDRTMAKGYHERGFVFACPMRRLRWRQSSGGRRTSCGTNLEQLQWIIMEALRRSGRLKKSRVGKPEPKPERE